MGDPERTAEKPTSEIRVVVAVPSTRFGGILNGRLFVMQKELHPAVWLKAAAEVRDFLVDFKALQLALEEGGMLEKRMAALRKEEASILAERQAAAAEAVAAPLAHVEALKREEADLTPRVVRLREEAAAAQEALSAVTGSLKEKQKALAEIEGHIAKLKAKLGVS